MTTDPPWTGCWSIAGLPPSSMSAVPIYTPGWRETKWSKVPCLRRQCDRRGLNPGPPDAEFEVLTTRPHTPPWLFVMLTHLLSKMFKTAVHSQNHFLCRSIKDWWCLYFLPWGGGGGRYSMWWSIRGGSARKRHLFQASGVWKARDFTSWNI